MRISITKLGSLWPLAAFLLPVLVFFYAMTVKANPVYFPPSCTLSGSPATTSPIYMTAGTATTTLTCDSYVQNLFTSTEGLALLIQLRASSTATTLKTEMEYSTDAKDWYSDSVNYAATSTTLALTPQFNMTWTFASSTIGGNAASTTNNQFGFRIVRVVTPTRYVRAVFTLVPGSAGGAVWATMVPQKQKPE